MRFLPSAACKSGGALHGLDPLQGLDVVTSVVTDILPLAIGWRAPEAAIDVQDIMLLRPNGEEMSDGDRV